MDSFVLRLPPATLAWTRVGNGAQTLLAFHGFGQDRTSLYELAAAGAYTTYCFDLFYHGQSRWDAPSQPLTKAHWRVLLGQFLDEQSIGTFSTLGYSLGGRYALATAEAFPDRTRGLLLVAPDGITESPWYRLATGAPSLRAAFGWAMRHPQPLLGVARLAGRLRLLPAGLVRFAAHHLATPAQCAQLYHTWLHARMLHFDIAALATTLRIHGVATTVYLGRYDAVLSEKAVRPLLTHLPDARLETLDSGHARLLTRVAARLAAEV